MLPRLHRQHLRDRHNDIVSDSRGRERIKRNHKRKRHGSVVWLKHCRVDLLIGLISVSLSLASPGRGILQVLAFSSSPYPRRSTANEINDRLRREENRILTTVCEIRHCNHFKLCHPLRAADHNDDHGGSQKESSNEATDPKEQAISALSQPNASQNRNEGSSSLLPPPLEHPSNRNKNKKHPKAKMHPSKKILHAPRISL